MRKELVERRLECLDLYFQGKRPGSWVKRIASKHGVTESAIWSDWKRRGRWMKELHNIEPSELKIIELLSRLEKALEESYRMMRTGKNEGIRTGAMKTLAMLTGKYAEIAESAGLLPTIWTRLLERLDELEREIGLE